MGCTSMLILLCALSAMPTRVVLLSTAEISSLRMQRSTTLSLTSHEAAPDTATLSRERRVDPRVAITVSGFGLGFFLDQGVCSDYGAYSYITNESLCTSACQSSKGFYQATQFRSTYRASFPSGCSMATHPNTVDILCQFNSRESDARCSPSTGIGCWCFKLSEAPSTSPTPSPSVVPSAFPTIPPTLSVSPTSSPTVSPTISPTMFPSAIPTPIPSSSPSFSPSLAPTSSTSTTATTTSSISATTTSTMTSTTTRTVTNATQFPIISDGNQQRGLLNLIIAGACVVLIVAVCVPLGLYVKSVRKNKRRNQRVLAANTALKDFNPQTFANPGFINHYAVMTPSAAFVVPAPVQSTAQQDRTNGDANDAATKPDDLDANPTTDPDSNPDDGYNGNRDNRHGDPNDGNVEANLDDGDPDDDPLNLDSNANPLGGATEGVKHDGYLDVEPSGEQVEVINGFQ
eukprot:m.200586 g.200586  ORF g.200586 m.200586 type:complete len:459 (-) comp32771_c1_seq2:851-2227(-)